MRPLLLGMLALATAAEPSSQVGGRPEDDAQVYGAALDTVFASDWYPDDSLLIESAILAAPMQRLIPGSQRADSALLRAIRQSMPRLRADTERSFAALDGSGAELNDSIPTRRRHRFIAPTDTVGSGGSWPRSVRYRIKLSAVAYSSDGAQALVYIVHPCPLCGWGKLVLLSRGVDGTWRPTDVLAVWFS